MCFAFFSACKFTQKVISSEPVQTKCNPPQWQAEVVPEFSLDELLNDSLLTANFSKPSIIISGLYGMSGYLKEYQKLKRALLEIGNQQTFNELVVIEKRIRQRLEMAYHETETVARYLECEEDYFDYLQEQVDLENDKADSKLTKAAILTGAATSAVVGVLLVADNGELGKYDVVDWIGVVGGGIGAYFAVKSSKIDNKIPVEHKSNPLRNIWENDNTNGLFPETLWTLLNLDILDDDISNTIREEIVNHWQSILDRYDIKQSDDRISLMLSDGSIYNSEMLNIRAQMLEQASEDIERIVDAVRMLLIEIG
jgi:hypothetical protein